MSVHREISFEDDICGHLGANGWLYAAADAARYDRLRALFSEDVSAWVEAAQPKVWQALVKSHGSRAGETLHDRLRVQLNQRGTLDVLRHGIELLGVRQPVQIAQFKPTFSINPDIFARYKANRLRVVRQVRYSQHNENCLDLVLFLNGVPVATAELKTDFTQSVNDAIDQYRFDRLPRLKGEPAEPLLSFPSGALVHFAVSNSEVHLTTKLEGSATAFLPFNQGDHGAKGNPPNHSGHRTAYLWEQVLARESWLEIIGRYLIAKRDERKQITSVIFPRYHQLDVTRRLEAAVLKDGAGGRYLVQHSAGSGKTNSIAWTAHFLAELHSSDDKKLFDSVLVVSDRNVIDAQLQEALFDFQRQTGFVATITNREGSKSAALADALSGDKKVVVCTIQTFPFALQAVRELAATQGKRFAVIADEAHSSQSGEAAANLRAVLSAEEQKELEDGGEISTEDILAAQMMARASEQGITFVAFTATPKTKTLELFGTRPDPTRKPTPANVPRPFHVYSMRQAIEEGCAHSDYAFRLTTAGEQHLNESDAASLLLRRQFVRSVTNRVSGELSDASSQRDAAAIVVQYLEKSCVARAISLGQLIVGATNFGAELHRTNVLAHLADETAHITDQRVGLAVINTIGEILASPIDAERDYLGRLLQASFAGHLLGAEPTSVAARVDDLRRTTFLVDSNVLVALLAKDSLAHAPAQALFSGLRNLGADVRTTRLLIDEATGHLRWAVSQLDRYGPTAPEVLDIIEAETDFDQTYLSPGSSLLGRAGLA